ncbi:MAG: BON domain-containing protein, partial [Gammaproteobacteria bacterium]|nr:BON domain-containing protein [Gemmatimonadota bacterium]NIR38731.1 BON domain-containing protein [Actinomycetota bacterium]NIU76799.1 BON domain-containing protein [Gammaproteobacteria bacterium]NIX22527.1 BON domain-containing protein [Actinomycetota bacterium]
IRALASTDERIADEIKGLFDEAGVTGWRAEVEDGRVQIVGQGSARDARLATALARTVTGVSEVHAP